MVVTNTGRNSRAGLRRRSRYGLSSLLGVLGAALLLPGTVVAGTPSVLVFDARDDFRASPNEANPSGPWSYRQRDRHGHRPLLAQFRTDWFLVPGLEVWHGTEIYDPGNVEPHVGVNTSGSDQLVQGAVVWPAGALLVHPGKRAAVIIQWKSPKAGKISVRAAMIDRNSVCGDGFRWSIRRAHHSPLVAGLVPNGGSATAFLAAIKVDRGSAVELRIGTGPGSFQCDSTEVRLRIVLTRN